MISNRPGIEGEFNDAAVIIFAKYPRKGEVKKRLAADTGSEFALRFYEICAYHIFKVINDLRLNRSLAVYLYYLGTEDVAIMRNWVNHNFTFRLQTEGDLGSKMKNAFRDVFNEGYKRIILIGTDIPEINNRDVLIAFNELLINDVVVSPSQDGGYTLIGMRNFFPQLFDDIKWSSTEVLPLTISKLQSLKLPFTLLHELNDVDTLEDLLRWFESADKKNHVFKEAVRLYKKPT